MALLSLADLLGGLNDIETKHAPELVTVEGNLELLKIHPRISVVGSRKVSQEGVSRTRSLTKELVSRGVTIVSGLAEGVDTIAHETAIALGGKTIGVLGTPIDQFYPKQNKALQERMMSEQLVLSQFSSGTAVRPQNFPIRNRTMALISDCTIIIEAQNKSGSLHQGWEALRLGRPLFILQSSVETPGLTWPEELLYYGSRVLTRNNLESVFESVPSRSRGALSEFTL